MKATELPSADRMKPNASRMKSTRHKLGQGLRSKTPEECQDEAKGLNQEHTVFQMTSELNLERSEFQKQPDGINEAFAAAGTPIMSHTSVNLEYEA